MPSTDRRPSRRTHFSIRHLVAGLLVVGVGWAAPVHADLLISVPDNVPATAGASDGFFDVSLTVTGTYNIGAFQFTMNLPGASGVAFVGADLSSPNYIFPDSSGIGWTTQDASSTIIAGDLELNPPGYVTITDTTVSLGRVLFRVDQAAPGGTAPITFDLTAMQTLILDDAGSPLDYSARAGSILVTSTAVPEPSSLLMSAIGAIAALTVRLLRRPLVGL